MATGAAAVTDGPPAGRSGGWSGAGPRPGGVEGREPGDGLDLAGLVRMLAVVAAIVAVFILLGWTPVLIVIVAIIVMVMVHEAGHMVTAKWSGMRVTEYFVGFGPRLWSVRKGETDYGFKPILLGGYVKIPGMTNLEEIDPADEARTYRQQPFLNRLLVACAGSATHFIMAFVLLMAALLSFGNPVADSIQVAGFSHWAGHTETAAQAAGLRVGDEITAVNGRAITDPDQFSSAISSSPDRPVRLTVVADGRTRTVTVTPAAGHKIGDTGEALGPGRNGKTVGLIGIEEGNVNPVFHPVGLFGALSAATTQLGHLTSEAVTTFPHSVVNTVDSLKSSKVAEQTAISGDRPSSLPGAVRIATEAEQRGVYYLLLVLVLLNLAFGILNMLPILPFDGGHVAIAVYERIRTRKGRAAYHADVAKMLPAVYAFGFVVVLFVLGLLYLDITHPISLG